MLIDCTRAVVAPWVKTVWAVSIYLPRPIKSTMTKSSTAPPPANQIQVGMPEDVLAAGAADGGGLELLLPFSAPRILAAPLVPAVRKLVSEFTFLPFYFLWNKRITTKRMSAPTPIAIQLPKLIFAGALAPFAAGLDSDLLFKAPRNVPVPAAAAFSQDVAVPKVKPPEVGLVLVG